MKELVKYEWQGKELVLTGEIIRDYISTDKAVTNKEIYMFMKLCEAQKLNPFVKEAYLIKYGNEPATMVVGKETFLKRAEMSPDFDGYEITDNGEPIPGLAVTCKVYKKNLSHPISVTVDYNEYVGTKKDGTPNRMWRAKPKTMLRKVALMQALRESFPTALGGLYEENELDQRYPIRDVTPKPQKDIPFPETEKEKPQNPAITKADLLKPATDKPLQKYPQFDTKKKISANAKGFLIKKFGKEIGEDIYYSALKSFGVKHCTHFDNFEDWGKCIEILRKEYKKDIPKEEPPKKKRGRPKKNVDPDPVKPSALEHIKRILDLGATLGWKEYHINDQARRMCGSFFTNGVKGFRDFSEEQANQFASILADLVAEKN